MYVTFQHAKTCRGQWAWRVIGLSESSLGRQERTLDGEYDRTAREGKLRSDSASLASPLLRETLVRFRLLVR